MPVISRVSSAQVFTQSLEAITLHQTRLAKAQEQIASGLRVVRPSDDPAAAAQILKLEHTESRFEQYNTNITFLDQRLGAADSVLGQVTNLVQRIRELAIAANSGIHNSESRRAFVTEAEQRYGELIGVVNSQDESGAYIFSGSKGGTIPFAQQGNAVVYQGDELLPKLQISPSRQVAQGVNGAEAFMRVREGNGLYKSAAAATNTGTAVISPISGRPEVNPTETYQVNFTTDVTPPGFPAKVMQFQVTDAAATPLQLNDENGGAIAYSGLPAVAASQSYLYIEDKNMARELQSLYPAAVVFSKDDLLRVGGSPPEPGLGFSLAGEPKVSDEFSIAPAGNRSIFDVVQSMIDTFKLDDTDPAKGAAFQNRLNRDLVDLDNAYANISDARASVGARWNSSITQRDENDAIKLEYNRALSNIRDLDYAEAISRLNLEQNALIAAQKSFAQVQNLSLFNYI